MRKRKPKRKYSPEEVKQKLGRHSGVGFMASVGFKCVKAKNGQFTIFKNSQFIVTTTKDKFVEVAMKNGWSPVIVMEEDCEINVMSKSEMPQKVNDYTPSSLDPIKLENLYM